MSDQNINYTQQGLNDKGSLWHAVRFMIRQAMGFHRTATPVKIVKVYGGGVGPPPTVDVQPLVNQINGARIKTEHSTVYGLRTTRTMAGSGHIIADPQVGDVGWLSVGDRDHTGVMNKADKDNPSTFRRGSLSDGVYTAGLNPKSTPNQYFQFRSDGFTQHDVNKNQIITGPGSQIAADPNGTSGTVYLGGDGKTGTYAFVQTVSGPSINVKARIS